MIQFLIGGNFMNFINRNDLIQKISLAQNRIRFLGVLAINLDWQKFS